MIPTKLFAFILRETPQPKPSLQLTPPTPLSRSDSNQISCNSFIEKQWTTATTGTNAFLNMAGREGNEVSDDDSSSDEEESARLREAVADSFIFETGRN